MKVFISWSGTQSKAVATALHKWIPDVIQVAEPWMSETDIEAGARWGRQIETSSKRVNSGLFALQEITKMRLGFYLRQEHWRKHWRILLFVHTL